MITKTGVHCGDGPQHPLEFLLSNPVPEILYFRALSRTREESWLFPRVFRKRLSKYHDFEYLRASGFYKARKKMAGDDNKDPGVEISIPVAEDPAEESNPVTAQGIADAAGDAADSAAEVMLLTRPSANH